MNGVEDPDEQLEYGLRNVREGYRRKVQSLEGDVGSLKQTIREKDLHIEELQRRIMRLEMELQENTEKQQLLLEEKNKIINDNLDFTQELRKTKKELGKLQEFKRAIMSTFEGEESAETSKSEKPTNLSISSSPTRSFRTPPPSTATRDPLLFESNPFASSTFGSKSNTIQAPTLDSDTETLELINQIDKSIRGGSILKATSPSKSRTVDTNARFSVSDLSSSRSSTTQVDGKLFFKEAREKLTLEQFNSLLTNIKKLNNHTQTREETLERTRLIFGNENKELYWMFSRLLSRQV